MTPATGVAIATAAGLGENPPALVAIGDDTSCFSTECTLGIHTECAGGMNCGCPCHDNEFNLEAWRITGIWPDN